MYWKISGFENLYDKLLVAQWLSWLICLSTVPDVTSWNPSWAKISKLKGSSSCHLPSHDVNGSGSIKAVKITWVHMPGVASQLCCREISNERTRAVPQKKRGRHLVPSLPCNCCKNPCFHSNTDHSGIIKGPADPTVWGHKIVVWMWDNLETLNYVSSKAARLAVETYFFRDFTAVSSKIIFFVQF